MKKLTKISKPAYSGIAHGVREFWEVKAYNGVNIGTLEMELDGFYNFYIDEKRKTGYLPAQILREIADKLDEINAPWEKQLREDP